MEAELLNKLPSFPLYSALFIALSLAPILAVITTSFLKIVVVIHLVKNALGLHEVPPNVAISSLAMILSAYVMAPVGIEIYDTMTANDVQMENLQGEEVLAGIQAGAEPLRAFLIRNSDRREREFYVSTAKKVWPEKATKDLDEEHLLVLIPSFTTSQLKSAFEVGFLLYLPFVVIDLIISNILLALGMIMVSPIVISVPFKLLLFVLLDGWTRLIHGLILSYQ